MGIEEPRDALGLARRALDNLDLVKREYGNHGEGHVVTQIVATALVVLVLPWEDYFRGDAEHIHSLAGSGAWTIIKPDPDPGHDMRHLRNALAHGRMNIENVSRLPEEVVIFFEDRRRHDAPTNWEASIRADRLEDYARTLVEQLAVRFG